MESFSRRVWGLVAGLFILGLMGCGEEANDRIDILIKETRDVSRDLERAAISLSAIELLRADDLGSVYLGERRLLELVTPSNVSVETPPSSPGSTLLVRGTLPAGFYRGLRLTISGGLIQVVQIDGSIKTYASEGYEELPANVQAAGPLILPEEALSGLGVPFADRTILGQRSFDIRLDFDVVRSFSQDTSGVDRWVMHPHVTAEASLAPFEP